MLDNLENKKKAMKAVSLVAVLFLFLFILVWVRYKNERKTDNDPVVPKKAPELSMSSEECNFGTNEEIFEVASRENDLMMCTCIEDEAVRGLCSESIMDVKLYNEALGTLNADLCEEIKTTEHKTSCLSVVEDSTAQLKENDPQRLADIYAASHSEKAVELYEELLNENIQDGSKEAIEKRVENYLGLALAQAERGLLEQEKGNDQLSYVEKGLVAIERAKKLNDKNSEIYRVEGYIYEIKPDYHKALVSYSKSLEINPKNPFAYVGKGHVYRMMGLFDEAVESFEKAIALDPQKRLTMAYTNLCNLEYSRFKLEKAIKNCTIVTEMEYADPISKAEAYQILASIYLEGENFKNARAMLLEAKTITPNDANLYLSFSMLNLVETRYKESEEDAKKAVELAPTKANAYLSLSEAVYMQERYEESIEIAEKGFLLIDKDVSLLLPEKDTVKVRFYYMIANNYKHLGNVQRQEEYTVRGDELSEKTNKLEVNK